jgi:hypothetical protein
MLFHQSQISSINFSFPFVPSFAGSWGSSVSIVSDYGLDERAIEVRCPAAAKDFSSNLCVQRASSGTAFASCLVFDLCPVIFICVQPEKVSGHHTMKSTFSGDRAAIAFEISFLASGLAL